MIAGMSVPRYAFGTAGGSGNTMSETTLRGADGRNDIRNLDCWGYPQPEVTIATASNENEQRAEVRTSIPPPQTMKIKYLLFFFNDTAPTKISPLSLHDPLPI